VIASLWVPFSWVYTRFSIAPRVALVSEWPESGKSKLRKVMQEYLLCRPNREVLGTSAVLKRFIDQGPGTVAVDEVDFLTAEAKRNLQLIWNLGHERGAETSLMIGGRPTFLKLYAPMLAAGLGGSLGGFLTSTQLGRTFVLELERYRPGRRAITISVRIIPRPASRTVSMLWRSRPCARSSATGLCG
jgi:hypothetical protein